MKIKQTIKNILFPRRKIERFTADAAPEKDKEQVGVDRELLKTPDASGLNIIGHIYAPSGRGEDARTGAMAASAVDLPFSLINTFGEYGIDGKGLGQSSDLRKDISASNPHDVNLFFLNADEMSNAYKHLGKDFYNKKYNIGCWAWELREFPNAWLPALDLVDEIWAPSRFIQDAISQKTDKPVIYMPLVVDYKVDEPLPRSFFNLPEKAFVFLTFFDFTSYFQRKNPFAVVEAYKKACANKEFAQNTILQIKLNNWGHDDASCRKFEQAIKGYANIRIIKEVLTDSEMKSLVNCSDSLVSLHRSEGFGRGPAEAMALQKPVIVTGYSGNMDYCNEGNSFLVDCRLIKVAADAYPYGVGQVWADADIDHAAQCMLRVADMVSEEGTGKAKAGYKYVTNYHSPEYIGRRYLRRLAQLSESFT